MAGADVAALARKLAGGARFFGLVDTIVGPEALARDVLRGIERASDLYDIPVIGGHLTVRDGDPAVSAFVVGEAGALLASRNAAPGQQLLVAEEDGKILGTMVLIIVPNLSHGGLPWAAVENVMVDADYRRHGIGKLLMDYALAEAKKAGCYKLQLISDKTRTEAHKFYRAIGYKASGHGFRLYL